MFIDVRYQFLEVRYWFEGFFIVIDIDYVDMCVWYVFQYFFYYVEVSVQDRYNGNFFVFDLFDFYWIVLVFNSDFFSFQIGGGFISQ